MGYPAGPSRIRARSERGAPASLESRKYCRGAVFLEARAPACFDRRSPGSPGKRILAIQVVSPFDGSVVREVAFTSDADLDAKLDRAQEAFVHWRAAPLEQRVREV